MRDYKGGPNLKIKQRHTSKKGFYGKKMMQSLRRIGIDGPYPITGRESSISHVYLFVSVKKLCKIIAAMYILFLEKGTWVIY